MVLRTDVRTIDEAEQVEKRDGGNDHEIDLQTKLALSNGIKFHQRDAITEER
jgi:hypothetical protein